MADSPEEIRPLHQMCREGRLYDVERWIADGKPLQLAPEAIRKGTRPKTALQVPVPPRGYWARVRSGYTVKKPRLPKLNEAMRADCAAPTP